MRPGLTHALQGNLVGQEYAVRLKVAVGEPLLHVRAVDKVLRTHQIKITHLDEPHAGMEEFLPFRHLVVAWKDRRRFLHDEQNLERVRKLSSEQAERITLDAIQMVLEASGETSLFMHSDGHLSGLPDAVHRLCNRSHIPGARDIDPASFEDRAGTLQMTFLGAERLARAFASAEPDAVTMYLDACELELSSKGYDPGERFWHDVLRKQRPMFALARQWAGFESERERLQTEVARLRNVLGAAVSDLRRAGLDREAARLSRAVDGR